MLPFWPGSTRTALIIFTNPKPAAFSYEASLQLGTTEVARAAFTLDGGQSAEVSFMVTVPGLGKYPVYLFVSSGGTPIATFVGYPMLVTEYKVGWIAPVIGEPGIYEIQQFHTRFKLETPYKSGGEYIGVAFSSDSPIGGLKVGEPIIIRVTTMKSEGPTYSRDVRLYIDGILMGATVAVFRNELFNFYWRVTFMSPGSYLVDVEGLLATFSVL